MQVLRVNNLTKVYSAYKGAKSLETVVDTPTDDVVLPVRDQEFWDVTDFIDGKNRILRDFIVHEGLKGKNNDETAYIVEQFVINNFKYLPDKVISSQMGRRKRSKICNQIINNASFTRKLADKLLEKIKAIKKNFRCHLKR